MTTLCLRARIVIVAVALTLAAPLALSAQGRDGIGLGVIIGEPTGITAISWLGQGNAIDFVAAWSLRRPGSFYLHADYQYHGYVERPMTVFGGLGAFVQLHDDPVLGLRVPLGISYLFRQAPLDLFAEVAPGITLLPATSFVVGGGIGVRFYF